MRILQLQIFHLFFDNLAYFDFVRKCRDIGIEVPVIPGIKPVAVKKHLDILPKVFGVGIPG